MIGWLDAASGASGDMLLGALVDAGVDENRVRAAIDAVSPEPVELRTEVVRRGGLAARRAHVTAAESTTHRVLTDIQRLISDADLDEAVKRHARSVFGLLAEAEAQVHGVGVDEVHFHEVGALDAIADVVGVCAAMVALELTALRCSAVAVGSGTTTGEHGTLSVPPPAVVALLRGVPTYAGPVTRELCTPTGAALLRHWVTDWGPQPAMAVDRVGVGAGGRDLPGQPNVLRLLVGEPVDDQPAGTPGTSGDAVVYATNVDDLDPRLWPAILARLLEAGASDAWLTPILMKKGRPAHTLSVLARAEVAAAVQSVVFAETSAIGLRAGRVAKVELAREVHEVQVGDVAVRVKVAWSPYGRVVNVQPEYDDVTRAAAKLGRPIKAVLAAAVAEAAKRWPIEQLADNGADSQQHGQRSPRI